MNKQIKKWGICMQWNIVQRANERDPAICSHRDEPRKPSVKWNKPDTERKKNPEGSHVYVESEKGWMLRNRD